MRFSSDEQRKAVFASMKEPIRIQFKEPIKIKVISKPKEEEVKFSPKADVGSNKKMTDFMDLSFDEKLNYDTYDNRRYVATQMMNVIGSQMENLDKITLMNLIMDYSLKHGSSNVKHVDWKEVDRDYAHLGLESTKHNLLIGAYDMPSKGLPESEFARKGKPSKEEYVELAVKEFGTTYEPLEAGFVLPDGTMLDFSGKKQGGSGGTRAYDHRQIGASFEDFDDLPGYTEGMQDFMVNTGALRISVNRDTLNVNYIGSLTDKQKDMIMTMSKGRDVVLDYDTKMGSGYETEAYEEIMTTEPGRYQKIRGFLDTHP